MCEGFMLEGECVSEHVGRSVKWMCLLKVCMTDRKYVCLLRFNMPKTYTASTYECTGLLSDFSNR